MVAFHNALGTELTLTDVQKAQARENIGDGFRNEAIAGRDYSLAADGSTNDGPSINAIIQAVAAKGGGTVILPPATIRVNETIDNNVPRVTVRGFADRVHDVAPDSYGTVLLAGFAGVLAKHRTPYGSGAAKNWGGGFENIVLQGNGVATRCLEIDSVSGGTYTGFLTGAVGAEALLVKCGVSGTDLGEPCDVQDMQMNLFIRQIEVGQRDTHCAVFDGSSTGNANTSMNFNVELFCQHYNGDALLLKDADNNLITLRAIQPAGTGALVRSKGSTSTVTYGRDNAFRFLSGTAPIIIEGTDTGGVILPSTMAIQFLDTGNATPAPTVGTGAHCPVITSSNIMRDWMQTKAAIGQSDVGALAALAYLKATPAVSQVIHSAASAHQVLISGAGDKWLIRIEEASGELQMVRLSGAGSLNIGSLLKAMGGAVSVGAADSGGVGFKVLRIPN